jgi:DNA-binding MarR family transcriptional regulator
VRWLTPEEQRAWRGFVRLHERLGGRLGRLLQSESHLSPADFAVLVHLTDTPEGRQRYQDLARALEWEKSRMSHHIARMAGRGGGWWSGRTVSRTLGAPSWSSRT